MEFFKKKVLRACYRTTAKQEYLVTEKKSFETDLP